MKKWILLIVCLVVISAGGVAFYILSQPPKEKLSEEFKAEAVTRILGRKAQLDPVEVKTGNTAYQGEYITFEYPARAVIYEYKSESAASKKTLLESFSFDLKSPSTVFNLQVQQSKASDVEGVSAVKLRKERSYEYESSKLLVDGVEGIVFAKTGTTPEKSGFFLKNGVLYTISVTGVSSEDINTLFDDVMKTASFLADAKQ